MSDKDIVFIDRAEMIAAVERAKKNSFWNGLRRFLTWMALGFVVQTVFYAGLPLKFLLEGDADLMVYAHIIAWPLFLIWQLLVLSSPIIILLTTVIVLVIAFFVVRDKIKWWAWKRNIRMRKRNMPT